MNRQEVRDKMAKSKKGIPAWNKGVPLTEEHKAHLRGERPQTCKPRPYLCGRTPWNKGLTKYTDARIKAIGDKQLGNPRPAARGWHHTPEWCEMMRDKFKDRIIPQEVCKKISETNKKKHGAETGNWRGGISFEPYCPKFNEEFKERVRAFFGYECVECHKTTEENGRALSVHHVNYDKMMCCNDVKPLFVSVCVSHNAKANGNREYWENHFTELINEKYGGICYLPKNV
jgi:hypothetical protein